MEEKIIGKSELGSLLNKLREDYSVIAPALRDGEVTFDRIDSADEVVLDFSNTKRVPKSVFFPQEELMFAYSKSESGTQIEEPALEEDLMRVRLSWINI